MFGMSMPKKSLCSLEIESFMKSRNSWSFLHSIWSWSPPMFHSIGWCMKGTATTLSRDLKYGNNKILLSNWRCIFQKEQAVMYLTRFVVRSLSNWPPLLRTSLRIHRWVDSGGCFLFYSMGVRYNVYHAALTSNFHNPLCMQPCNQTQSTLLGHLVLVQT